MRCCVKWVLLIKTEVKGPEPNPHSSGDTVAVCLRKSLQSREIKCSQWTEELLTVWHWYCEGSVGTYNSNLIRNNIKSDSVNKKGICLNSVVNVAMNKYTMATNTKMH